MPLLLWVVSNVLLALLLGLAAWTVQLRWRRPALAHGLWVLALVKLVTPPLASGPVSGSAGPVACALGLCACDHHSGMQAFVRDTLPWILLSAWAIGAVAIAAIAALRWMRFRRLTANATPASPEWQTLAERISCQLGLRRAPLVRIVPGRMPPMVVPGWPCPVVLMPFDLMSMVSGSQKAALLHELVHIKRRDHCAPTRVGGSRPTGGACRHRWSATACLRRSMLRRSRGRSCRRDARYAELLLDVLVSPA